MGRGNRRLRFSVPAKITQALGTKRPVPVMSQVYDSELIQVTLVPVGGGQHYVTIEAVLVFFELRVWALLP